MSSSDVEMLKTSEWKEILVMIYSLVTWEQVCGVWCDPVIVCGPTSILLLPRTGTPQSLPAA